MDVSPAFKEWVLQGVHFNYSLKPQIKLRFTQRIIENEAEESGVVPGYDNNPLFRGKLEANFG